MYCANQRVVAYIDSAVEGIGEMKEKEAERRIIKKTSRLKVPWGTKISSDCLLTALHSTVSLYGTQSPSG